MIRRLCLAGAPLALAALALALLSPGAGTLPGEAEAGVEFETKCVQTGGTLESVSCVLIVKGLPDPLDQQVTVAMDEPVQTSDAGYGSVPSDTVVASEAPPLNPETPSLVLRTLSGAPPEPAQASLDVPEPPPKAV